ncbi:MAG: hypothetical protein WCT12_25685 [Verrucomicrobiota bacterium]
MELAKYIILLWQGQEQAVAFPMHVKHADVWNHIRRECPAAQAVSAGFFADEPGASWLGGVSETLKLQSRPQDGLLIQRMLHSRDRRNWDLRVMVWEACEAVRRRCIAHNPPAFAMGM